MSQNESLPPLPTCATAKFVEMPGDGYRCHKLYTADQTREYALAAIESRRQELAPPVSPWLPIAGAPKNEDAVVWVEGDWAFGHYSPYYGWCDMEENTMHPQPTHYLPIPPMEAQK